MSRFALRISHVFLYKKVEDASVFVFWVRDRMFGEYSRRGLLCTYAKSCVLPHLCAKERIGVCVYVCVFFGPSCQTAAIFVSQTGKGSWRGTPIV